MSTIASELFEMLKRLHDSAVDLTPALKFDQTHKLHRATVAYYASIVELSGACCELLNNNHTSAFPIVLRAVFEAHIDLINLVKDPQYCYTLEIDLLKSQLEFLKLSKEGNIDYLSQITAKIDLDARLTDTQTALDAAKQKGTQRTISDKFVTADMKDEYKTLYAWLCSHSHNNLSTLSTRHIETTDAGTEMVMYRDSPLDDYQIWIGIACELLLRSIEVIHDFLKSDKGDEVKKLRAELIAYRNAAAK